SALTVTAGTYTSGISIIDDPAISGSIVNFNTSGANAYSESFNVTLDETGAGAITFNGTSSFSGTAGLSATTLGNISFALATSALTTAGGNVSLFTSGTGAITNANTAGTAIS